MKLLTINEMTTDYEAEIKQSYQLQLPVVKILNILHHTIKKVGEVIEIVLTNSDSIKLYSDGVVMPNSPYKYTDEYMNMIQKENGNIFKAALNIYEQQLERKREAAKLLGPRHF